MAVAEALDRLVNGVPRYPLPESEIVPCAEYRVRMHDRLASESYFQGNVASWGIPGPKDPPGVASTIAQAWPAIELLFDAATAAFVFGDDRLGLQFPSKHIRATDHAEWPAWATPRPGKGVGRTLRADHARAARDFLSIALARGVVQLFSIDPKRLNVDELMKRLSDPIQVHPRFGIRPDAAKRFVRRAVSAAPQVLLTRNAYGLAAEFHGPPDLITAWFDRALSIGRWTEGYEKGNCRHDVRPFEVGSTMLWESVSRKRHGLEVAIEELRAAEADPNADDRTTPRAMAAAELLAALAGHPPRVYTEQEPDLDWRIAKWMDERRSSFNVTRADLALARRAMEAVVERSTLPDRRWRTLPPKAKWEQAMLDLMARLTDAERAAQSD